MDEQSEDRSFKLFLIIKVLVLIALVGGFAFGSWVTFSPDSFGDVDEICADLYGEGVEGRELYYGKSQPFQYCVMPNGEMRISEERL